MRVAESIFLRALLPLFLSCCATQYQPKGFTGGYADTQIDSNTVLVSFKGNGYTPRERVQLYLLYRCAQVTHRDGFDYFVVINGNTESRASYISDYSSNTTASAYSTGNYAFGAAHSSGSGSTIPVHKYGSEATIKMFRGIKPSTDPNAYDAQETLRYFGPELGIADQNQGATFSEATGTRIIVPICTPRLEIEKQGREAPKRDIRS